MVPGSAEPENDEELIAALEPGLRAQVGESQQIHRVTRRLSEYRSSFAIEELEVELSGGCGLKLVFKNLSPRALLDEARRIRPTGVYDPLREIEVYRRIFARYRLGTATCYAAAVDPQRDRYWLFLEKVPGLELYKIGELSVWEDVAGWLARFHRLAPEMLAAAQRVPLLRWNRDHYGACLERARACQLRRTGTHLADGGVMHRIGRIYDRVVERLISLPPTVIHGELYASNVLVQQARGGVRICPIDWETAGVGPAPIDLGALVAGGWSDEQRNSLVGAYWSGLDRVQRAAYGAKSGFDQILVACRLVLALQLLGRSTSWKPPAEHSQDWLREADFLVRCLE